MAEAEGVVAVDEHGAAPPRGAHTCGERRGPRPHGPVRHAWLPASARAAWSGAPRPSAVAPHLARGTPAHPLKLAKVPVATDVRRWYARRPWTRASSATSGATRAATSSIILAVVLASLPFYFLSLDLPRKIVNEAIQGRAFESGNQTAPFLET